MADAPGRQLVDQMVRASRFERLLYAEVAADATATRPALQVVVIAVLAAAFAMIAGYLIDPPDPARTVLNEAAEDSVHESSFVTAFVLALVLALALSLVLNIVGWLAWSGISWLIGTRMIATDRQDVEFLEVARATGFAQAPGILNVVVFIPVVGFGLVVSLVVLLWMLGTGFLAIRESMRLTNAQAVATMVVGVIPYLIVVGIGRELLSIGL